MRTHWTRVGGARGHIATRRTPYRQRQCREKCLHGNALDTSVQGTFAWRVHSTLAVLNLESSWYSSRPLLPGIKIAPVVMQEVPISVVVAKPAVWLLRNAGF